MRAALLVCLWSALAASAQPNPNHNLVFDSLAKSWDEGIPLGDGILGALVWQKGENLRISLDRADLWDERKALDLSRFDFKWVKTEVENMHYDTVQKLGDAPYEDSAFPTKIPAGALEFAVSSFGRVIKNVLDIRNALNTITFQNGVVCNIYMHATKQAGYFGFENLPGMSPLPELIIPGYQNGIEGSKGNSIQGQGLQRLGYPKGAVFVTDSTILYHQPTWYNHYYEIFVEWRNITSRHLVGAWTISVDQPVRRPILLTENAEPTGWAAHANWWQQFWSKSAVSVPDSMLEKQYYLEMYKLGAVARKGAPAITLQAVWTADNGSLPPWKGDFHNDLNTQLSYWPCYTSNHLEEASTFTDWLWGIKEENKKYTRQYFGVHGLNVPGVATLHGYPMGGWIQYALSPTTGAWLAQHFYWQWKYSMDDKLLVEKVYPYLHDVANYLEELTYLENGKRKLPLSSSPEYNDNDIQAWFSGWTNYDLALTKFLFGALKEVCDTLHKNDEEERCMQILNQLPEYAIDETGLAVAVGQDLEKSHRHLSPYMAIYPLGLLHIQNPLDKSAIELSLEHIKEKGTSEWCGYTFAWMACIYAITRHADSAAKMLKIFASDFCGSNSFHLNGDQKGGGYSLYTYRPFTLEGNFAFAQGIQEMLIQSHLGYIEVFPAVPETWKDISFTSLRTEGGFLVSARKENGVFSRISIEATVAGKLCLKIPFTQFKLSDEKMKFVLEDQILVILMQKGESITLTNTGSSFRQSGFTRGSLVLHPTPHAWELDCF